MLVWGATVVWGFVCGYDPLRRLRGSLLSITTESFLLVRTNRETGSEIFSGFGSTAKRSVLRTGESFTPVLFMRRRKWLRGRLFSEGIWFDKLDINFSLVNFKLEEVRINCCRRFSTNGWFLVNRYFRWMEICHKKVGIFFVAESYR